MSLASLAVQVSIQHTWIELHRPCKPHQCDVMYKDIVAFVIFMNNNLFNEDLEQKVLGSSVAKFCKKKFKTSFDLA